MEYGYSILMGIFAGALLLYAGLMALTKDYKMLPYRARTSVKPKNPKKYMTQLAKVIACAERISRSLEYGCGVDCFDWRRGIIHLAWNKDRS